MPYGVLPNGTAKATLSGTAASDSSEIGFLVSEGGAVVDTSIVAGGTYTVAAALKHDSALGDTADGGLVKKGVGTLALSGVNTFTGRTVVEEGVLQALSDDALPTVTEVRYGATLDLGGASRRVGGLAGDGVVQNGTLVLAGPIPAGHGVPFLDCDLATVRGAAIDFGRSEANPVPYGTKVRVAQLTGTAAGSLHFKAINTGCDCALDVTVEDGFVYVTTKGNGVKIVIR